MIFSRFIITSILVLTPAISFAGNNFTAGGIQLELDTVYHAQIGPGTKLTQLHLSGSQPMDVHYITLDLSTPNLSIRTVAGNTSNGLEKTSSMAQRSSINGNQFIAGVNGDFYDVTTTYPDGSTRPRKTTYTSIIDGKIRKTSPQAHQFIVDNNGKPYINTLSVALGSITNGTETAALGGMNLESINSSGDAAADNAVTVYTSDGWKSTYQTQFAGNCAEVTAKYLSGSAIETGKQCQVEITSAANSTGNTVIPANGVVLLGRGSGKSFIESLKPGDIITIDNTLALLDGTTVIPFQAMGGNPKTVANGIALESDGTRPDAVDIHPRTGIGISQDGTKVIMMVIDGRGASIGATTRQLGDLMVYAGVYEGLNMDGGGSSTCYTAPFGVVNKCSDAAGERAVAASIFAVANGNAQDKEIKSISFEKWEISAPRNGIITPVIYGYNADGLLIDKNVKDYTLELPEECGTVTADGKSFVAVGFKPGLLKAIVNGITASVVVKVLDSDLESRLSGVHLDGKTPYQVELYSVAGNEKSVADPSGLYWVSNNPEIASVDDNGIVKGVADGETIITGTVGETTITLPVTVEVAGQNTLPVYDNLDDWKINVASVKLGTPAQTGESIVIPYTTGPSVTNASITMVLNKPIFSHPESILIDFSALKAVKKLTLTLVDANKTVKSVTKNISSVNGELNVNISEFFDVSDATVWPVTFRSLAFVPGEDARTEGSITLSKLHAYYGDISGVEELISSKTESDENIEYYDLSGLKISPSHMAPGLYIRKQGSKCTKIIIK